MTNRYICCFVCIVVFITGIHSVQGSESEFIKLDLNTAITLANRWNTDLKRADIDLQSDAISVDSAQQAYYPNLSLSGSGSSRWSDSGAGSADMGINDDDFTESMSMKLSSSYTLFDGFARQSELASSEASLIATEFSGKQTLNSVVWQVANVFLRATAAQAQIQVQEENLLAQQKLLDQITAFYDAGKRPVADLYQQQAEMASAEYSLITTRHNYELLIISLLEAIGLPPDTVVDLDGSSPDDQVRGLHGAIPDESTAVSQALENRSDYQATRQNIVAARENLRISQSGNWPTVSLSADAGSSWNSSSTDSFGDQFGSNNPYASVGISISLPVFNRHATRNSTLSSELQIRRLELQLQDLEHQIISEIRQAYLEYEATGKQLVSSEKQVVYAQQALDNYEQRYAVNASTLLEVIQARARLLSAQYDTINAETELLMKQVALAYYSGKAMQ